MIILEFGLGCEVRFIMRLLNISRSFDADKRTFTSTFKETVKFAYVNSNALQRFFPPFTGKRNKTYTAVDSNFYIVIDGKHYQYLSYLLLYYFGPKYWESSAITSFPDKRRINISVIQSCTAVIVFHSRKSIATFPV